MSEKTRFGVVVPWMNRAVEDELPRYVGDGIALHWARVSPAQLPLSPSDESYLDSMRENLPFAVRDLAPTDLAGVIFACTSGSLVPALDASGIGVVTTFGCLIEEILEQRLSEVLLCTPYSDELNALFTEALELHGIKVARCTRIRPKGEFRDIALREISHVVKSSLVKTPSVSGIVVSCTALYTEGLENDLAESGIGLPLVTSMSAMASHMLRRSRDG